MHPSRLLAATEPRGRSTRLPLSSDLLRLRRSGSVLAARRPPRTTAPHRGPQTRRDGRSSRPPPNLTSRCQRLRCWWRAVGRFRRGVALNATVAVVVVYTLV